ncbi:hypothetical protein HY949_03125 [Candidatus Gottesmanbacteria bacterium]|nr:hypothetical protein [Candidatus Gottesmanbacteria bacterium]
MIIIIFAWAAVVLSNYTLGTFLTGWDNLHPEFDFFLNVKRSFFAVWQEYQGPGLLGGMGHAADLPRQLMLWAVSIILPAHLLRWGWTFFMLLIGPLGVYALLYTIITQHKKMDSGARAGMTDILPAFAGAIFYLFNLVTVQVFTAPFDAFVTHYGILPWLLWSNWEFLHTPSRRTLLLVVLINVLGMTHAYIPTLFLVYLLLLSILSMSVLIHSLQKATIIRILTLGFVTFCINAFWLLPFTYFTLTKSPVTVGAKINQMATGEIYLQNKAFGDIQNVATLKSYWYNTADYNADSSTLEPVLGYWRNLDKNSWMPWVRYALAAFIFFGGVIALMKKSTRVWGVLGIVAIGMVAVDTPPFVWMIDWLRLHIPLFSQFFRFPFTKWGIALALSYSVWLGIGVWWMLERLKAYSSKVIPVCVVLIPTSLAIIGAIGMLQGQLISPKFKLTIPDEYFQLFTKFKALPPGRIANLPQNTFWGWSYYRWGYSGSGFLWYGIENPIMDRAFDVWTAEGEQYYWELSRALYSKDAAAVDAVLTKYDVRYVLLDESIVSPSSDRGLFIEESKELLAQMPEVKEIARFGNLTLFERWIPGQARDDKSGSQSFISLKSNLPTVPPIYGWTDNDVAYGELGDYITKEKGKRQTEKGNEIVYPFRSLFTKRNVDDREFTVTETPDTITIGSRVEATAASILKASEIVYDSTRSAPARNASRSDAGGDLVADKVQPCGVLRDGTADAQNIDQYVRFTSRSQRGCLSFWIGNLPHRDGYLVAVESRHIAGSPRSSSGEAGRPLLFSLINQTARHVELETYLDNSKLKAQNSKLNDHEWQTDYFVLPPLAPDGLGYSVYVSNDAVGRQETINDIKSIKFYRMPYQEMVSMRIPPSSSHSGLDPESSSQKTPDSRRSLSRTLMRGGNDNGADENDILKVDHPNPAYYKIVMSQKSGVQRENATLILNQSIDPGWKAFTINTNNPIKLWLFETLPFLFGTQIKEHVLVNNWSNGWRLPEAGINTNNPIIQFSNNPIQDEKSRSNPASPADGKVTNNQLTVVIFFLPQLLQWIGFLLLPIPFICIAFKKTTFLPCPQSPER